MEDSIKHCCSNPACKRTLFESTEKLPTLLMITIKCKWCKIHQKIKGNSHVATSKKEQMNTMPYEQSMRIANFAAKNR